MKNQNLVEKQKARLAKVSNQEWNDALEEVKGLVNWRLFGSKADSGAHSEMVLGTPAVDHYVGEAV